MNGWTLLILSAQAVFAVAALCILRLSVLPGLDPARRPVLLTDVWGPIALVAPFLVAALGVDRSVAGAGWIIVGGPVCVGAFVAGSSLLVGPLPRALDLPVRLKLSLVGAGVVVLLLAAAHELTIWTGQIIFAIAAVLLWINSPPAGAGTDLGGASRTGSATEGSRVVRSGVGLAFVVVLALAQGVCVLWGQRMDASGGGEVCVLWAAPGLLGGLLLIGYGFGAGVLAVGTSGAPSFVRLGGWTAALGAFLGIGTISAAHLLPQAAAIVLGRPVEVQTHVAHSFGVFLPFGILLLALAAALWLVSALFGVGRRLTGFVLITVAAALVAARLTDLWSAAGGPGG